MKLNFNLFICMAVFSLTSFVLIKPALAAVNFDRQPDVTINTSSLFDLPKDIVAAPLLKDLLTEDFVFYYRDGGADWMSFRGALARMAFENQVDWPTKVVAWILNGPAEIALWKGEDGKLKNFMAIIDQTAVKDLLTLIAKTAASDSQLKVETKGNRKVYTLTLSTGRAVFLAAEASRLFIYTDASMKVPTKALERSFLDRAKSFFGANQDVSLFGPKLGKSKHVITASAEYLSFGYQDFLDGVKSLRFEFSKNWAAQVFTSGKNKTVDLKNWEMMPKGAAFCLSLPLNIEKIGMVVKADKWLKKSQDSAISCWYPDSKLYTPVFAVRGSYADLLKQPNDLKNIFTNMVGVREAVWEAPKQLAESEEGEHPAPTLKYLPMLPVVAEKVPAGQLGFSREIGGRYGLYPAAKSATPQLLGSRRFFKVKVVATADVIVFSPDDQLVNKAMTTIGGKFPSMAVEIPKGSKAPILVVVPEALSKLAKISILESLPASQESIFRTAVSRQLIPNLDKFGKQPAQAGSLSGSGDWKAMEWTSNVTR